MPWRIGFDPRALRSLAKLDHPVQDSIVAYLEERVIAPQDPRMFGEALKGPKLRDFWRYKVGDYRIVVEIRDWILLVYVIDVGNRKEIYKRMRGR